MKAKALIPLLLLLLSACVPIPQGDAAPPKADLQDLASAFAKADEVPDTGPYAELAAAFGECTEFTEEALYTSEEEVALELFMAGMSVMPKLTSEYMTEDSGELDGIKMLQWALEQCLEDKD